jgi:hypothetical protein
MGLWNRKSLSALATITELRIKAFETEPLFEHGWYQSIIESHYLRPWQRRLFHRLGFAGMFAQYVRENAHTQLPVTRSRLYTKRVPLPSVLS